MTLAHYIHNIHIHATHNKQTKSLSPQTYQRIRANRQRRLKLRTRKRHHTVESMLGYELDDDTPRRPEDRPVYDTEDEPVDVEGDSLGWPDANIHVEGESTGAAYYSCRERFCQV